MRRAIGPRSYWCQECAPARSAEQMRGLSSIPFREPQSVARLSRTFSQSLSAVDLAEPLLSLDETQPASAALSLMREKNSRVLGVRHAGLVTGWVTASDPATNTLGEAAREFQP